MALPSTVVHFVVESARKLTTAEQAEQREKVAAMRELREAENAKRHAEAATEAATIWSSATPAPDNHPYLTHKAIKPHGLRVEGSHLVVPVRANGELVSIQRIAPDGEKRFLTGGRVAGGYCSIGNPEGAKALCIVEGFATGATVHEATGLPVAVSFNAGNLLAVSSAMRERFPDLPLIVCADDDHATEGNPGVVKATEAARAVAGLLAVPEFGSDRPDKATDFNDMATHSGLPAVAAIITAGKVAESQSSSEAPEPLRRPVPPPEPYPIAELGPVLRPVCEAIRRVIQAPDAVCAGSLLAAASLAVQGLADIEIDGRIVLLTLWLLTVAESGERKSACDSEAMRPAHEYEKTLAKAYADALASHEAELEEWMARRESAKALAKKTKGEGTAQGLLAVGPAPVPPLLPKLLAADFTAEGLAKLLAAGLPSMGAFTDEAALVFGGHGMTKESIARTAGTLCKLWDSGTLDRIRAGDGAVKLYGRRVAMHLMAQPVIAEAALSDDVLSGQGFLARCLLAWPESTAGHRPYVPESLRDDPSMLRYVATLAARHALPLPIAEGERNELAPRRLNLSPEAFTVWRGVHDAIEAAMAPGARYAMVKPWASKTPEQCLRIAGVLTLTENPDAQTIDTPTIERAAELAIWHLGEAARLAGTAEISKEVRDAEALLDWAHETGRTMLYSRVALQFGPSRIRERERFNRAMDELTRAGWATPMEAGTVLDGARRRHVWQITPKMEA